MMNLWEAITFGFGVASQPANILYVLVGVITGNLVGVLPGVGPVAALSLLLPITYHLEPTSAIIMLAGIYYGAMYGGTITSVLINVPGETASVITCIEGYQMAKKGRAGAALSIAAIGSFIGGIVSVLAMAFLAIPITKFGLKFGPPEMFSLLTLSFILVASLSRGSRIKGLLMIALGLFLSLVGLDSVSGEVRFTFATLYLQRGLNILPIVMGIFGIGEVLVSLEEVATRKTPVGRTSLKTLLPSRQEWKDSTPAIGRGTVLGFFLGIIPGGGAVLSSFLSYALEKAVSKHPEKFGSGVIEGVAGPETANNAGCTSAFIPMFTLGLPTNAATAILLGALMIHGLQPGPLLMAHNPEVFWGTTCSMFLGNAALLILNIPFISLWVQIFRVPYGILFPLILVLCLVGSYSVNHSVVDMVTTVLFGLLGYGMRKREYDPALLVLAFVLGDMFELALRQSLIMSSGTFGIFIQRRISAVMICLAALTLISPFVVQLFKKLQVVLKDHELT